MSKYNLIYTKSENIQGAIAPKAPQEPTSKKKGGEKESQDQGFVTREFISTRFA